MIRFFALALIAALPVEAAAQQHGHSPYAGLEGREIKSLSKDDLEELRHGAGWGMALPAELNGVPGPAHLLELQDEIGLDSAQVEAIEAIFAEMQAEAKEAGARFIEAEVALEEAFREGNVTGDRLRRLVAAAAAVPRGLSRRRGEKSP